MPGTAVGLATCRRASWHIAAKGPRAARRSRRGDARPRSAGAGARIPLTPRLGVQPRSPAPGQQQNPGTITGAEAGRGLPGDCVSSIPTAMPMPQRDRFAALSSAHSPERLGAYRRAGDDDAAVLARYLWNTLLGHACYPTVQAREGALRTSAQAAVSRTYGRAEWYDAPAVLQARQQGPGCGGQGDAALRRQADRARPTRRRAPLWLLNERVQRVLRDGSRGRSPVVAAAAPTGVPAHAARQLYSPQHLVVAERRAPPAQPGVPPRADLAQPTAAAPARRGPRGHPLDQPGTRGGRGANSIASR